MTIDTILTLLIPIVFVTMLVLERIFPARKLPKVRGWFWKGLIFFVISGAVGAALPTLGAMGLHALRISAPFHLSALGTIGGAIAGFLVSDLVGYFSHRLLHNVPFLWRWTHQMHHSAERLDVAGSNYFHPFDIVALGGTSTLATLLLGLTPEAAALAGFIGFFTQTFTHLNIKTPRWLGYIVQRPEAHAIHHARGVHAYNYGTFMLWDIALGTFRNPMTYDEDGQMGFWDGASSKLGGMLIGRDVSDNNKEMVTR